mgnify:CR=1 FL=1
MSIVLVLDETFKITNGNSSFYNIILPKNVALGLPFSHIFQDQDQKNVTNFCEKTRFSLMETFEYKIMMFSSDPDDFPHLFLYKWTLVRNIQGYTAITVYHKSETVNDEVTELKDFFNKAPIALHWLSSEGKVLWANDRELDVLGYTRDEYIGQEIMKFCPDSKDDVLEIFKQLGSGNTIRDVPVRFRKKNGQIQDLLIDSNVNYTKNGDFNHTRCFIRDDTQRLIRDCRSKIEFEHEMKISNAKKKFLTMIMHVLKTPIHIISMIASNEMEHDENNQTVELFKQATLLSGLVSSISKAIQFEDGLTIKPKITNFNLYKLISGIKSQHFNCHLEIVSNCRDVYVSTDKKILETIFLELLSHADSRSKCVIRLKIYLDDNNDLEFVIEDDGVKLDEIRVEEVFHNYWMNTSEELSSIRQATDVKLNVAFNFVQCLGSQLYVDSNDKTTKLIFKLSVPILYKTGSQGSETSSQTSDDSEWFEISPSLKSLEKHIKQEDIEKECKRNSSIESSIGLKSNNKHILLVEDNSICQKICKRIITKLGHTCDTADNGKISVDMVHQNVNIYDIVFMDIRMPIMDGLEASKIISTIYPELPIVAFSAEEISLEDLNNVGITSIMKKPAGVSDVQFHINEYSLK